MRHFVVGRSRDRPAPLLRRGYAHASRLRRKLRHEPRPLHNTAQLSRQNNSPTPSGLSRHRARLRTQRPHDNRTLSSSSEHWSAAKAVSKHHPFSVRKNDRVLAGRDLLAASSEFDADSYQSHTTQRCEAAAPRSSLKLLLIHLSASTPGGRRRSSSRDRQFAQGASSVSLAMP